MSWATHLITKLTQGETVQCRPRGNSMTPRIKSGELVTIRPITIETVVQGDIVLARIGSSDYLHLCSAVEGQNKTRRVQISNNHGHVNGWTRTVYGLCVRVEK